MAQVALVMPKMGESIMEATIIKWIKNVGDVVEAEETILEIATDKVDSDVPAPVSGILAKILFEEDDTVEVGKIIAYIATEGEELMPEPSHADTDVKSNGQHSDEEGISPASDPEPKKVAQEKKQPQTSSTNRFYSPLVKNIAQKENIPVQELEQVVGTGLNNRVTKNDILNYIKTRKKPIILELKSS